MFSRTKIYLRTWKVFYLFFVFLKINFIYITLFSIIPYICTIFFKTFHRKQVNIIKICYKSAFRNKKLF